MHIIGEGKAVRFPLASSVLFKGWGTGWGSPPAQRTGWGDEGWERQPRTVDPPSPMFLGEKPCCPYRPQQETSSFLIDLLRGHPVAFVFTQGEQLFTF